MMQDVQNEINYEEFLVENAAEREVTVNPDPRTVEMIRYYQQARKQHGFSLIEVPHHTNLNCLHIYICIMTTHRFIRAFARTRSLETHTF